MKNEKRDDYVTIMRAKTDEHQTTILSSYFGVVVIHLSKIL